MTAQFDKDLQEISSAYEAAKEALLSLELDSTLSYKQRVQKFDIVMRNVKSLRNYACTGLKAKEQSSNN